LLEITNQLGQVIEQKTHQKYGIGDHHFPINTAQLTGQTYFVVMTVDGVKQAKRLLVF
jgi:hypothetical protein